MKSLFLFTLIFANFILATKTHAARHKERNKFRFNSTVGKKITRGEWKRIITSFRDLGVDPNNIRASINANATLLPAVIYYRNPVAEILIRHGCTIDALSMQTAVITDNLAMVRLLTKHGASLGHYNDSGFATTPLHQAVQWCISPSIVETLLKREANPKLLDLSHSTPLALAYEILKESPPRRPPHELKNLKGSILILENKEPKEKGKGPMN